MNNTIKATCTRCGGSGSFSFNLIHGTKCYGCMGVGFKMVDAAKQAKADKARAVRNAKQEAYRARREQLAASIYAEMNAIYGPFPATEKGSYDLMVACQRATGKTIGDMVRVALAA